MKALHKNITIAVSLLFGIVATVVSAPSTSTQSSAPIYLFTNPDFVGDRNQVLGIARAVASPSNIVEVDARDAAAVASAVSRVQNTLQTGQKVVAITSGEYGAQVIAQLPEHENLITCHSSHQYAPSHPMLFGKAKIVALPTHAVDNVLRASYAHSPTALVQTTTRLVQTIGVAHNLTREELAYEATQLGLPADKDYMAVILGGDAEAPDRTMRYYTVEAAQALGAHLAAEARTHLCHLLILNGPRTGKHNPQTGAINEDAHKGSVDPVTQAFVDTLRSKGLQEGSFTLFDFQFGVPSAYKAVLGTIARQEDSMIFVPGESTSMISECIDTLPGKVTIFTHEAMSEVHHAHVESEYEAARARISDQGEGWRRKSRPDQVPSAAQIIAQAIGQALAEPQSL